MQSDVKSLGHDREMAICAGLQLAEELEELRAVVHTRMAPHPDQPPIQAGRDHPIRACKTPESRDTAHDGSARAVPTARPGVISDNDQLTLADDAMMKTE